MRGYFKVTTGMKPLRNSESTWQLLWVFFSACLLTSITVPRLATDTAAQQLHVLCSTPLSLSQHISNAYKNQLQWERKKTGLALFTVTLYLSWWQAYLSCKWHHKQSWVLLRGQDREGCFIIVQPALLWKSSMNFYTLKANQPGSVTLNRTVQSLGCKCEWQQLVFLYAVMHMLTVNFCFNGSLR